MEATSPAEAAVESDDYSAAQTATGDCGDCSQRRGGVHAVCDSHKNEPLTACYGAKRTRQLSHGVQSGTAQDPDHRTLDRDFSDNTHTYSTRWEGCRHVPHNSQFL